MQRIFIILAIYFMSATSLFASETITTKISGMVCPLCAHNIEKSFSPYIKSGVIQDFDVNLDTKIVIFNLAEDKSLSDEVLTQGIKDAGYLVKEIKRTKGDK